MVQIETFQILGCGGIAYEAMWGLRNLIVQHWGLMFPDRIALGPKRHISTIDGDTYQEHNISRQGFGLDAPPGAAKAEVFLDFFLSGISNKVISGRSYVARIVKGDFSPRGFPCSLAETQEGLTLLMCCPDNNQCRLDTWEHIRAETSTLGSPPCIVLMAGCERDFGQVTLGFSLGRVDYHSPFALTPTVVEDPGARAACGDQTVQANICTAFLLLDAVGWVLANLDDILSPDRPEDYLFPNWFWAGSPMKSWGLSLSQTKGGN